MCCKSIQFLDHVIGCEDIRVNAVLSANTDFVWEVKDGFANTYLLPFTTDDEGIGTIDVSQLPEGFCNPYAFGFELRLKPSIESCDYIDIPFIQKYESVKIELQNGNTPKSYIGCPYTLPNNSGFISDRKQFIGDNGQTTYQNNDLKNSKQVIVFNEMGVLQQGAESSQYQFDTTTGELVFGQAITNQSITIIYFK